MSLNVLKVELAPADPILGLATAFRQCTAKDKINLGIGAYRNDAGAPVVFSTVKEAEHRLLESYGDEVNKEYSPSSGLSEFNVEALRLTCVDEAQRDLVAVCQTHGGTGALYAALNYANLSYRGFPERFEDSPAVRPKCHVTTPTWTNHFNIARICGFEVTEMPYYSREKDGIDTEGLLLHLEEMLTRGDVVLLHGVAHNPTGADPDMHTMGRALDLIERSGAICVMDVAYLGFASGSLKEDRWALDLAFARRSLPLIVCLSFSKNMGLYGDRLGCTMIRADSAGDVPAVRSQLDLIVRRCWSNPAKHPAQVAAIVLSDPDLRTRWEGEIEFIAKRIDEMRNVLTDRLAVLCPRTSWSHLTKQIGMFAFTGLSAEEVERCVDEFNVFIASSGRISVAGLNHLNVGRVAEVISLVRNSTLDKVMDK